jgi:hypothetical protein
MRRSNSAAGVVTGNNTIWAKDLNHWGSGQGVMG